MRHRLDVYSARSRDAFLRMGGGGSKGGPSDPTKVHLDHFERGRQVGEGGFGKVYCLQHYKDKKQFDALNSTPNGVLELNELLSCDVVAGTRIQLYFAKETTQLRAENEEEALRWAGFFQTLTGEAAGKGMQANPMAPADGGGGPGGVDVFGEACAGVAAPVWEDSWAAPLPTAGAPTGAARAGGWVGGPGYFELRESSIAIALVQMVLGTPMLRAKGFRLQLAARHPPP